MGRYSGLKRELGLADIIIITVGTVISAELFILPGMAYAKAGPAVVISLIMAGLIALPSVLSAAELVTAMPKEGGIYYYCSRSMGYGAGTLAGFSRWFAIGIKTSFALLGLGAYAAFFGGLPMALVAIAFGIVFMIINILGVRVMERVQVPMTIGMLGLLAVFIVRGMYSVSLGNFSALMPNGLAGVISAAGFLFFSYGALLIVTTFAEEIKRPERNIPLGMILSLLIVGVFYGLTVFVTVGVMDPVALEHSLTPVSDAGQVLMGPAGVIMMAAAAILASVSTANSGLTAASRYPMAMSRDSVLPSAFGRVSRRFGTPVVSILFTGAFMLLTIAFLTIDEVVRVASTLLIMTYILANLSVIGMREYHKKGYAPRFRSPFYPWTQLLGTIALVLLLLGMGRLPLALTGLFVAGSLLWYRAYVMPRARR